ncbi:MAG: hypothetical protein IJ795_02815 [Bacteroidales bacterium]|nr:hypothetical protein [Bacteroidales bacterium]
MKHLRYIAFASLCLFAAVSCREKKVTGAASIPFVEEILSDTTSRNYSLVSSYDSDYHGGTISITGAPEDVMLLAEAFITADMSDNIDGKKGGDMLPDFAGEVIAPVLDVANAPYEDYFTLGNDAFLKEVAVRNFLFALDTVSLISPFDPAHTARKVKAKTIILASSLQAVSGQAEIDTLCRVANPGVEVISALDAMMADAAACKGSSVLWTTRERRDLAVFDKYFERHPAYRCPVYSPAIDSLRDEGSVGGRLLDMLDDMAASGKTLRIGAIVLDDNELSPSELQEAIDMVRDTDDDYLLVYKNMLAPDCKCISAGESVTRLCYRRMRERNSFTHRIAYPSLKCYVTTPAASLPDTVCDLDGSMTYSFRYYRESGSSGETYSFVELRDRYISEALLEKMKDIAPKTYSLYVR